MELLVHRVMSEAGFYAPAYAALALKQSEGSTEEAVFLLRAYRSTLSRDYYSKTLDGEEIRLSRRISAAFKDVAGGQFLGATYDYTHRLLDFSLLSETPEDERRIKEEWNHYKERKEEITAPRVSGFLRQEGLITDKKDDSEPADITLNPLTFPGTTFRRPSDADQSGYRIYKRPGLCRNQGLWPLPSDCGRTSDWRTGGYHRTSGTGGRGDDRRRNFGDRGGVFFPEEVSREDENDPLKKMQSGQGDKVDQNTNRLKLAVGYGLVFGRNDTKAIAMSILDA